MPRWEKGDFSIERKPMPPSTKKLVAQAFAEYELGGFPSYRQAAISILEQCYPHGVGTCEQRDSKINYLASEISQLKRRS